MIPLYALALWGLFLAPRRFAALAGLLLSYNTLMAMVFAGTVRYRAPWDFLLALLAAFALARLWKIARERGYVRASGERRVSRAPPCARCSAPARTTRAPAHARQRPKRPRPIGVAGQLDDRGRERVGVARRHEQTGLAGDDDLGQAADGAGDDRTTALHRLERHHAEALAERRHEHDRRALHHARAPGTWPRKRTVPSRPSALACARSSASSGPEPAISSSSPGSSRAAIDDRAQERVVALDRHEPADDGEPGRVAGVRLGLGSRLDAVVDDLEARLGEPLRLGRGTGRGRRRWRCGGRRACRPFGPRRRTPAATETG